MDKPNQLELPKELVESLKQEKEDNKRRENIEKLNAALVDKQNNLSIEQTNQLISLKQSLESDTLQSLEDKAEANSIADETLGLLTDIKGNTEDLKFEFSDGSKGIVEKILVFGKLLVTSFATGLIRGMLDIFDFPTLKSLFSRFVITPLKATLFKPFIRLFDTVRDIFRAIGDVYKKVGTGKFLKGNTYRVLGAKGILFFETIFKRIKQVVDFLKIIGGKIKTFFLTLKGLGSSLLTRLITPFIDIKNAFMDIVKKLKALGGDEKGPLSKIIGFVKNLSGLATKLNGLFKLLGFALGKLIFPIMMAVDAVVAMIKSFKTSEFTNPIAKGIDMILSGIGGAVGGFIGGLVDLVKDLTSWITDKLGFEGLSEFLDSFSIREMIERGFADMAEFFNTLFTDFVPALIAGVKAAANPLDGKSFGEAFQERLAYGPEGKPESTIMRREGEITPEEIAKYANQIEGMSAPETISFIKQKRIEDAKLQPKSSSIPRFSPYPMGFMSVPLISTGAQMEATQNDTIATKEAKVNIAPVINTTDASTTTSNIVSTSTNQNSHIDRTMGMSLGNMLLQ